MRWAEQTPGWSRGCGVVCAILFVALLAACGDQRRSGEASLQALEDIADPTASVILHCGLGNEPEVVGNSLVSRLPARIPAGRSSAFWSEWRPGVGPEGVADRGGGAASMAAWSGRVVDAWSGVPTPVGLFVHRVAAIDGLRGSDGTPLLAICLSFDPHQRSSGLLPLAPEDQAILRSALESGLLSAEQRATLEGIRDGYLARWKTFQEHWVQFVESPRNDAVRDRFMNALVALPGSVMSLGEHERFLTRAQRVALRAAGHVIEGSAWSGETADGRHVAVRNYPAKAFAERWNTRPTFLGLPEERPRIGVADGSAFEEIDLDLHLPSGGDADQISTALGRLRGVPQLRVVDGAR